VELAGRIRDLRQFESSSGKPVAVFVLFDARASVLVFAPWERLARMRRPLGEGDGARVRGRVRTRGGKKVCDALDVEALEGGIGLAEGTPDGAPEGDSPDS
jgi:hypothetical protein